MMLFFILQPLLTMKSPLDTQKNIMKITFKRKNFFFENCIKNKINRFIYSSTAAVYGNKNKRVTEKDDLKPISPYPKSKLRLENYLKKKKSI